MTLEKRFEARLRAAISECREIGYNPTQFERMLNSNGAVSTVQKLVVQGLQTGFQRMRELNRLDLTAESIMLEDEFRPLFKKDYLDAAQWRLDNV